MHIWYTSNTLFNTSTERDEVTLRLWNNLINPDDNVIVLGNFIRGELDDIVKFCNQLKGKIHVVIGKKERKFKAKLLKAQSLCDSIVRVETNSLNYPHFEATVNYKKTERYTLFGEFRDHELPPNMNCVDWDLNSGPVDGFHALHHAKIYNQLRSLH
ncbi:hypothetical protein ABGV42_00290 [Paenibacillus pabuli]|uniref:hypothetical protein n=1 Tax=Paenibacillus pabuli TaxID=1472 RepID=UPI0032428563